MHGDFCECGPQPPLIEIFDNRTQPAEHVWSVDGNLIAVAVPGLIDDSPIVATLLKTSSGSKRTSIFPTRHQNDLMGYNLSGIKHVIHNPRRIAHEFGWIYHRKILRKGGINIMSCDWDNFIILDACRADLFEEVNNIQGNYQRVISRGSSTAEFLYRNFKKRNDKFRDAIYISGNPKTRKHKTEELFFKSVPVWMNDWDEQKRTVPPKVMADRSTKTAKKHPNKRIIIHFIQPHYPFIGESGQKINHRTLLSGKEESESLKSVWDRLADGDISKERVWQAYKENLELTLPHVKELISELKGKTIVSSDHGNAFGQYGIYGHPSKHYVKELVEIPWLEIEGDNRKKIQEGNIRKSDQSPESVEERLSDLGYR